MRLEITITANIKARQDLRSRLTGFLPGQHPDIADGDCDNSTFRLQFIMTADKADEQLKALADTVSEIENLHGDHAIEVNIRNVDSSEPYLPGRGQKPVTPVPGIRIIPADGREDIKLDCLDIRLDPAHAFGTGQHPSTRLCLKLLQQLANGETGIECFTPDTVLDIGCGSGILSIAALRFGAGRVLGIEIDPGAVLVARRNIRSNNLEHAAVVKKMSLDDVSGAYDLVLANLVPSVLFRSAGTIAGLVREKGVLVAAGFPAQRSVNAAEIFAGEGLQLLEECSLSGWGALLLQKLH